MNCLKHYIFCSWVSKAPVHLRRVNKIKFTSRRVPPAPFAVAMTFWEVEANMYKTNSPWHPKSYDIEYAFTDTGGLGRIWS